ncbi:hypothetical protein F7Q99_08800 [Streptomyces kaniharaensis]|uniref:Uncharacterized protein n=1 Tax=Streptomyces kaniharaensis TaxID=212423 RepID=A0A6N7KLI4_9ACTN|nr:hypothetical protein [Streptomyces kaniharaensis]MQS12382.1 hypothetical protein [Streptomyces kaniharaensis]
MADTSEKDQNPWLYGQDSPPTAGPLAPHRTTGPWAGAESSGAPVLVQPAVLQQAASESRRLRGELKSSVTRAEPDTAAAVQALADGWAGGPALSQALTWWKSRWTSLDNRLGLAADRLDATARGYRAADNSAATSFKGP